MSLMVECWLQCEGLQPSYRSCEQGSSALEPGGRAESWSSLAGQLSRNDEFQVQGEALSIRWAGAEEDTSC